MATPKKPAKKRLSKTLTTEGTAELLGTSVETLMLSRARGLAPGTLGYKNKKNVLVWNRADIDG